MCKSSFQSCPGEVLWNDNVVLKVNPTDYDLHDETLTVEVKEGKNSLKFKGKGKSDKLGLSIDNVRLVREGTTEDIVINGDFEMPQVAGTYEIFNKIPGWEGKEMEIGPSSTYSEEWPATQVAELDGNFNTDMTQHFTFDAELKLVRVISRLSFLWASRTTHNINSRRGEVVWNDAVVARLIPSNTQIQQAAFDVELKNGDNEIQLKGFNRYGMIVDKVSLESTYDDTDLVVNGDFEHPRAPVNRMTVLKNSFKGWQTKRGEIGDCRYWNSQWTRFGHNQCIHLSTTNPLYEQKIKVEDAKYKELLKKQRAQEDSEPKKCTKENCDERKKLELTFQWACRTSTALKSCEV